MYRSHIIAFTELAYLYTVWSVPLDVYRCSVV